MHRPPLISFDMDGVICDGRYVERASRTPQEYLVLEPLPGAVEEMNKFIRLAPSCILTSRSYDLNKTTWQWLNNNGINASELKQVYTVGIPGGGNDKVWHLKYILQPYIHVDDDPCIIQAMCKPRTRPRYIIFMKNPNWPENVELFDKITIATVEKYQIKLVENWRELSTTLKALL